jgi:hypothetical protein
MQTQAMATVDAGDDRIQRYVVRRYAYDPSRHERRHQIVAAFDNRREFMRLITKLGDDLKRRRAAGDPVDKLEHITGTTLEPGYRRRQQAGRLLRSAIRHGVSLSDETLGQLDLPSNLGVLRLVDRRNS